MFLWLLPLWTSRVQATSSRGRPHLEDEIGVDLSSEDDDFETVAGLLMKAAGRMPEPGFQYETQGVHFEVLRADATRLLEVAVHYPGDEEDESSSELGATGTEPAS